MTENRRVPMDGVALARSLDLIAKTEYDGHFTIFGFTGGFQGDVWHTRFS